MRTFRIPVCHPTHVDAVYLLHDVVASQDPAVGRELEVAGRKCAGAQWTGPGLRGSAAY
jgi:hypothetical protein